MEKVNVKFLQWRPHYSYIYFSSQPAHIREKIKRKKSRLLVWQQGWRENRSIENKVMAKGRSFTGFVLSIGITFFILIAVAKLLSMVG